MSSRVGKVLRVPGVVIVTVLLVAGLGGVARAEEIWAVLPAEARGVDPSAAATFRDLLQAELGERLDIRFVHLTTPCAGPECAQEAGTEAGADIVVFSLLSALGSEIVVSVTAIESDTGRTRSNDRITVGRLEELDTAAERIAVALAEGVDVESTAELGMLTQQETEPALQRRGNAGFGLRLGSIIPLGDDYGEAGAGILIDLSFLYETLDWAIEPRVGVRFAVRPDDDDAHYVEVPIDINGFYLFTRSDIAPFVGGGAGVRFISEDRPVTYITGSVLRTRQQTILEDRGWGFATNARAGVMFLRTFAVHLAVMVDYNFTLMTLNERDNPQSLTAGLTVVF